MNHARSSLELSRRLEETEQALRARTFELTVIHELSRRIGDSLSYEELFRAILTHLGQAIAFDVAAGLIISSEHHGQLYLRSRRPLLPAARAEVDQRLLSACRGLADLTIRREAIEVHAVQEVGDARGGPPLVGLGSFFQVPIIAARRTVGVLLVGSALPEQFTEEHIRLLYTVAGQAAGAVQRMQDHLGVERRRLLAVVEHLPGGVVLLDSGRRVTLANPIGKKFLADLAGIGIGETLESLGGVPFSDLERRSPLDVVTEGPESRITAVTTVSLESHASEPWLVVLEDVTDVREAVRRRDRFLAMLGHELRNPLAALSNAADILRLPGAEAGDREEATEVMGRQIRHTTRLVDDLLDVSRFLHGKIQIRKQPVDLAATVAQVATAQRPTFEREGKRLELEIATGSITVAGDVARLTQVVDNLLNNARKFTPPGSRVELSCHREGNEGVVRICDQGIGIAREKQEKIFEPFMQVEQGTGDASSEGLGLGLALVKILVTLHGGSVAVDSEGPGCGSEFLVRLPVLVGQEAAVGRPDDSPDRARPRRVLIIEDQSDVREMFQRLLQLWGHRVDVAATGPEGLVTFRALAPEVAFIDIGLPDMNGYEVARAIRATPEGAGALLVALTGHAMPEDRMRALEAGFDRHMAKPIDPDGLRTLLGECDQSGPENGTGTERTEGITAGPRQGKESSGPDLAQVHRPPELS